MFKRQNIGPPASIVGLFCDPFAAVAAVRQLTAIGVAENEIDLIGVLSSHVADWNPMLAGVGLPAAQADYYRQEFEDGAVMLVIRTLHPEPKNAAVRVLKQNGGIVPGEDRAGWKRGNYDKQ